MLRLIFRRRGFGLMEATIALVILSVASVAFLQLMRNMNRGQKRVDQKSKLQDFTNRIRNLMFDQTSCSATLVNDQNLVFDPANLSAFNQDPTKNQIALKFGDNSVARSGEGIDSLTLQIRNEALPLGSGRYEAVILAGLNSDQKELPIRPTEISLLVITAPEGTGTDRKITGCYRASDLDGTQVCTSIGGKWVPSVAKCVLGTSLKLSETEWIDPAEMATGGPLEGSFVTTCFSSYHWSTKMAYSRPQACPNTRNPYYAKCTFDPQSFNGNAGWSYNWGLYKQRCDGGVEITFPPETAHFLAHNELTEGNFAPAPPTGMTGASIATPLTISSLRSNYDQQSAVSECFPDPTTMNTLKCSQGDNALEGKVGSCIFVDGSFAYGSSSVRESYIPNYTGWIWVSVASRLINTRVGSNYRVDVGEAAGRKCYQVRKDEQIAPARSLASTGLEDPLNTSVANVLTTDRFQDINECLFIGGLATSPEPVPTVLPSTTTSWSNFTGKYVKRFKCEQQTIDINNLVGETSATPSLAAKTCWYYNDVVLGTNYGNNYGVHIALTKPRYTGWVYLNTGLPDGRFVADTNTKVVSNTLTSPALNAVPCNAGIRLNP